MKKHLHNSLRALFLSLAVLLSLPMLAEEVEIDGIYYELNVETEEASVVSISRNYSGVIAIPESVNHNNTTYSVTSVTSIINSDQVHRIIIPSSVISISSNLDRLRGSIICFAITPPITNEFSIDTSFSLFKPILYVPAEAIDAYKQHSEWSKFDLYALSEYDNTSDFIFGVIDGVNTLVNYIPKPKKSSVLVLDNWTSTNKGQSNSSSHNTYTFDVGEGEVLTFDWKVSSEANFDKLIITLDGTEILNKSGVLSGNYEKSFAEAGSHTLIVEYTKDYNVHKNDDEASIYNINLTKIIKETPTTVILPESYKGENYVIGRGAFMWDENIKEVVIPEGITGIGNFAFEHCYSLIKVTLPCGLKTIGNLSFSGCNLEDIVIPNTVESIGEIAFYSNHAMTSLYIPQSVRYIGPGAFGGTPALVSITVDERNSVYDSRNNCNAIMETATNKLIAGCCNTSIPDGTTSICCAAFSSVSFENPNIVLPNTVETLEAHAFYLSNIESVVIPQSVQYIYDYNFTNKVTLYFESKTPPTTKGNHVITNFIISYVPFGCKKNYDIAPWNRFEIIEMASSLTIVDGIEQFSNENEVAVGSLTYTRTLPNLKWNALYVPFEIPVAEITEKYEVAYINDINSYDKNDDGAIDDMEMEIIKIKSGTLNANYPYLIKARNEEARSMSITLEDATLYPTVSTTIDCSSVFAKHEVTGIYDRKYQNELPEGCMAISVNGAWQPIATGSYLNPFRLYMTVSARDGSPVKVEPAALSLIRISVLGEDDMETGIEDVKTENGEHKTVILDLSGRRVQNPEKGGVYIVNGKKVVY